MSKTPYGRAIATMLAFRAVQKFALFVMILDPLLLATDIPPVRVMSVWILGLVLFVTSHLSRKTCRDAAQNYDERNK